MSHLLENIKNLEENVPVLGSCSGQSKILKILKKIHLYLEPAHAMPERNIKNLVENSPVLGACPGQSRTLKILKKIHLFLDPAQASQEH